MELSVWTLTHTPAATGTPVTRELGGDTQDDPGGWGFESMSRTDRSMEADTVALRFTPDQFDNVQEPRGSDPDDEWVYGDHVAIFKDGFKWFEGTVDAVVRSASGQRHIVGFDIAGPWQALEEITYYQTYGSTVQTEDDPPVAEVQYVERGDVTLMQRFDPVTGLVTVIRTGEQIRDLMTFAAPLTGSSPTFQVADLQGEAGSLEPYPMEPGIFVDFVRATDETVANLIRRLARWTPLCTSWFDYGTSPPTLHFDQLAPPTDIDFTNTGDEGQHDVDIDLSPNDELTVPYVKIAYKSINTVDVEGEGSGSYDVVQYDEFPAGASGTVTDHRKALRATVELAGADATIQTQKCATRTIPYSKDGSNYTPPATGDPPANAPGTDAWRDDVRKFLAADDRWPWLKDILPTGDTSSNIGVLDFKVAKVEIDDAVSFPPGEEPPEYDLDETPRALESGATAEWMNVKTQKVKVSATLIFKGGSRKSKNVRQYFNNPEFTFIGDNGNEEFGPSVVGEWTITATSAVSKTYERTTSQTESEVPPVGIAQKLYDDLSQLRHTGTIVFESDELGLSPSGDVNAWRPGMAINITNSKNPAWENMGAVVQEVTQSLPDRVTTLRVGVPNQLGLNDFVTLARLWRANPPSYTREDERSSGKASGASKAEGGEETPVNRGPGDPPHTEPNSFSIKAGAKLDANGNPDGTSFEFTVGEGWVTSERPVASGAPSTDQYEAIMPEFEGERLDNPDETPKRTITAALTIVWAEHKYTPEGVLESVEIDSGAQFPDDGGGGKGESDYRRLGQIELENNTETGELEAVVTQEVDSDYYWPGKIEFDGDGGVYTNKNFYLIEEVADTTSGCFRLRMNRYTADFRNLVDLGEQEIRDIQECGGGTPLARIQINVDPANTSGMPGFTEADEVEGVYTEQPNGEEYVRTGGLPPNENDPPNDIATGNWNQAPNPNTWEFSQSGHANNFRKDAPLVTDLLGTYYWDGDPANAAVIVTAYP